MSPGAGSRRIMAIRQANPGIGPSYANESTPLMVGGVLYTSTSLSQVAAIDAVSGETKWVFDPKVYKNGLGIPANNGWLHRGVAYWRNGDDERIVMLTAFAQMIALDAKTGKPVPTFGKDGRVDLAEGLRRPVDRDYYTMTSPPVIVRGVIVVGSSVMDWWGHRPSPPGDVAASMSRPGVCSGPSTRWRRARSPAPKPGRRSSWKETGNTNVWAPMSADEELGYVYLPVSTPTNDYYGGDRPGDGLYGESLVCLDVTTGKKVWHYQLVHHGLVGLRPAGRAEPDRHHGRAESRSRRSRKSPSRRFVYVFDRVTGEPVWPIEEQPVPASTVPGERASKTQPFPTKPAPFDIQGARDEDLIDLTPEIHQEAIDIAATYDRGGLFTPPSQRGTIAVPGVGGGAQLVRRRDRSGNRHALRRHRTGAVRGHGPASRGRGKAPTISSAKSNICRPARTAAAQAAVRQHRCDRHEHRASIAGAFRSATATAMASIRNLGIRERLGLPGRSWALVTKTVLIVVQMGYYSPPRFVPRWRRRSSISTTSIRICGSTTRPAAKCWRRSRCRRTPPARRSPTWPAASNISLSPSAAVRCLRN